MRLALRSNPEQVIFVSTAHFPWSGCNAELESGVNQRIPAAMKACEHFRRLVPPNEPLIFGGDFNDDFHPLRVLNEEFGISDIFECMDIPPPSTHPVRPSHPMEEVKPNRTLDWLTCALPHSCRVAAAFVKSPRSWTPGAPAASDHLPVVGFFELGSPLGPLSP